MRFKEFSSLIAEQEGLKKQTSIGNVREILKIVLQTLANLPSSEVAELLVKYKKKA